jgi:hypothetical protein
MVGFLLGLVLELSIKLYVLHINVRYVERGRKREKGERGGKL